jgi:hypothetical protein
MIVTEWTRACLQVMRDHRAGIDVNAKYREIVGAVDQILWRHRHLQRIRSESRRRSPYGESDGK